MELSDLPDDCLIALFRNCTLQSLLTLCRVSLRFKHLIHRLCYLKRSLKLFGSSTFRLPFNRIIFKQMFFCLTGAEDPKFANISREDDDLVIYNEEAFMTQKTIHFLVTLFPHIEVLSWCGFTPPMVHCLILLVGKWPHLHSLFIQGRLRASEDQLQLKLCHAINSLKLKRLDFRLSDFCIKNIYHDLLPHLEPTLSSVEQFGLQHRNCEGELLPVLNLLQTNYCTRFSLEYDRLSQEFLLEFIGNAPKLVKNLTHFRLQLCKLDFLPIVCEHFTNLEHLDLSVQGLEYFKFNFNLIENLSKLPKLSELRLSQVLHNKSDDCKFDFFFTPLLTVKRVFLSLQTRPMRVKINFNYDFLFEILQSLFPNLETMELYNNNEKIPNLRCKLKQFESLQRCFLNYENFKFL